MTPNKFTFDCLDIEDTQDGSISTKVEDFSFSQNPTVDFTFFDDTDQSPKINIDEAFDDGINLNAFLEEPHEPINSYDWLNNPEIIENPTEIAFIRDELKRQWVDRKSYQRVDYSQRPEDVASCEEPTKISLREVLQKVMRRYSSGESTYDESLDFLLTSVPDGDPVQRTLNIIEREKDLLGRLFIRAALYDDCQKGVWTDHIRSCNSKAKFIIAAKKCRGCYKNRGGRCDVFKKELVNNMPWSKALSWYGPLFKEQGIEPIGKTSEEMVISMFRATPYTPEAPKNHFPVDYMPVVPLKQAFDEVMSHEETLSILDTSYRQETKAFQNAVAYLSNLVRCKLLTQDDYNKIVCSTSRPTDIFHKAKEIVLMAREVGLYTGPGMDLLTNEFAEYSNADIMDYLSNVDTSIVVLDNSHKIVEENLRRSKAQIKKWVEGRMLSLEQAKAIIALNLSAADMLELGKTAILSKGDTPTYYGYGTDLIPDSDKMVTLDQAWSDISNLKTVQQVIDLSYRNKQREEETIKNSLVRWKQTGLLGKKAFDFLSSNIGQRPKHEILSKAAEIIGNNATRIREYEGPGVDLKMKKVASSAEVLSELKKLEEASIQEEQMLKKALDDVKRKGLLKYITEMAAKGILKKDTSDKLLVYSSSTPELKKAFELTVAMVKLEASRPLKFENLKEVEHEDYDGEGVGAIPVYEISDENVSEELLRDHVKTRYPESKITETGNTIIDLMNRGLSGTSLVEKLNEMYLQDIVENTPSLTDLLNSSNGIVGKLYLEPKPYFTNGFDGCRTGAKKLRSIALKKIQKDRRCFGCSQNRGDYCNIYSRKLVSPSPEEIIESLNRYNEPTVPRESDYIAEIDPNLINSWNDTLD